MDVAHFGEIVSGLIGSDYWQPWSFVPPNVFPLCTAGITHGADAGLAIKPATSQQYHTGIIPGADCFQRRYRFAKNRAVFGLIEQAPHRHARMVSIPQDYFSHRGFELLLQFGVVGHPPTCHRFFIAHQTNFVTQVQLGR